MHRRAVAQLAVAEVAESTAGRQQRDLPVRWQVAIDAGEYRIDQAGEIRALDLRAEGVALVVEHPREVAHQTFALRIALDAGEVDVEPGTEPAPLARGVLDLGGDVVGHVPGEVFPDLLEARLDLHD